MAYIKQRSNYVLQTKHKTTNNGTIWERDITTVGGLNSFGSGQYPIYQSSNFILTVNMDNNLSRYIERYGWEENENGVTWTLADVEHVNNTITQEENQSIKLKGDIRSLKDFSYFGSSVELIRSSINHIITTFPGEVCTIYDIENTPIYHSYIKITKYDEKTREVLETENIHDKIMLENPFGLDLHTIEVDSATYQANQLKFFACGSETWGNFQIICNDIPYEISDVSVTPEQYDIVTENVECDIKNMLTATVSIITNQEKEFTIYVVNDENNDIIYLTDKPSNNEHWSIRPKDKYLQDFYKNLNLFEQMLVNPNTEPKHTLTLEVLSDGDYSYNVDIKRFTFPTSYGGYNLDIESFEYQQYIDALVYVANYYDENFCDNIYRSMTHESIKNLDYAVKRSFEENEEERNVEGTGRMQKVLRLIAREFDEIKFYIDNLRNANIISYDDVYNLPDYFYSDTVKTEGWDIFNVTPLDLTEYVSIGGAKYYRNTDNYGFINSISGFNDGSVTEGRFEELTNTATINGTDYILGRTFAQNDKLTIKPYDKNLFSGFEEGYFLTCVCSEDGKTDNGLEYQKVSATANKAYLYDECSDTVRTRIKPYTSQKDYTMEEVNNHFLKMLKLNSRALLKRKGTIEGVEMMLSLFGLKSKRFCDTIGADLSYDYEISERITFTPCIVDPYNQAHGMHLIDWYNSTKLISYNSDSYMQGKYEPYQGLPVDYIYTNENSETSDRILFPYFSSHREIDGNPYYQMNGGWLNKYPYQFDKDNNIVSHDIIQFNEPNKTLFTETMNSVKSVKSLQDMLNLPIEELLNGTVCYVDDLSTDYIAIEGNVYPIYTEVITRNGSSFVASYITLEVVNHSVKIGQQVFDENITISNAHLDCEWLLGGQYVDLNELPNGHMLKLYIITNGLYETIEEDQVISEDSSIKKADSPNSISGNSEYLEYSSAVANMWKGAVSATTEYYTVYTYLEVKMPYITAVKYKKTAENFGFISGGTQLFVILTDENGVEVDSLGEESIIDTPFNVELKRLNNPSHYFKLTDLGSKFELGGEGWNQLDETDYDYLIANSIINYTNGNNPHRGNFKYDNGYEYIKYFTQLFKFALEDDRFDSRCYKNYVGMYEIELDNISQIGFQNLEPDSECSAEYPTYPSSKVQFFGEKYTKVLEEDAEVEKRLFYQENLNKAVPSGYSGYTLLDMPEYEFVKDIEPQSISGMTMKSGNLGKFITTYEEVEVAGEKVQRPRYTSTMEQSVPLFQTVTNYGITDQIINTKVVDLTFRIYENENYSKQALEQTKYFDSVIVPYVTQMIPSNTILRIKYEKAKVPTIVTTLNVSEDGEVMILGDTSYLEFIKDIIIDNKTVNEDNNKTYLTKGEHTIKYTINGQLNSLNGLFKDCKNLTSVKFINLDTSLVTDMSDMFKGCSNLTTLDLTSFDCSSVTSFSDMCYDCKNLTTIKFNKDLTFDSLETTAKMFYNCQKLEKITFPEFGETYNLTDTSYMFYSCFAITDLQSVVESLETSSVTNMGNMFERCSGLTELDLTTFDTSSVTNMSSMFRVCSKLANLIISEFDTSSVTTMNSMFRNCSSLTSLDLSGFDLQKVEHLEHTFRNCDNLTSITILGGAPSSDCLYSGMTTGLPTTGTLTLSTATADTFGTFSKYFRQNGLFWGIKAI